VRLQVANIYGAHTPIITNLTMLVMSVVGTQLLKPRSCGSSLETWRATFRRVGTTQQLLAPKLPFSHSLERASRNRSGKFRRLLSTASGYASPADRPENLRESRTCGLQEPEAVPSSSPEMDALTDRLFLPSNFAIRPPPRPPTLRRSGTRKEPSLSPDLTSSATDSKSRVTVTTDSYRTAWTREVGTVSGVTPHPMFWASSTHRFTNHSRGQRYQDHNPRSLQHCASLAWPLAFW